MSNGDVSELQQQVETLKHQLREAQKMTALGELVSTTTHEFNNVLMTILNYAKMGLRHRDDATRDKALEKILAAGERASRITNAVLGMARNRRDGFEPVQVAELIDESLVLLERELSKYRISIERRIESTPLARVNGNQIQQVLLNLLINARQAMPKGGTILIGLSYDEAKDAVELLVRDSGCGIAPDKLRRIFDPFFSTKAGPDESGKGGTGLGLSSCREIIEGHRGRIRVESTVGKGTAFIILLPVAKPRAAAKEPVAPTATAPAKQAPKAQPKTVTAQRKKSTPKPAVAKDPKPAAGPAPAPAAPAPAAPTSAAPTSAAPASAAPTPAAPTATTAGTTVPQPPQTTN